MSRLLKKRLTEKKIWNKLNLLQKELPGAHFTKIESSTINGIPDVHCCYQSCSFWLELKANQGKNLNVSKYQIAWHLKYKGAGGLSYILNWPLTHVPPKLYEIREPGVPVPATGMPVPVIIINKMLSGDPGISRQAASSATP